MIAQAYAIVSRRRSSDLQRLEVQHPPVFRGGKGSMVRTVMAIKGEIGDARSIRNSGVGEKRKGSQSSSSSGKKQRASVSQGSSGQGRGYQGQG